MSERTYLPLRQAAEIANCHPDTLRRAIRAGKLKFYRAGSHYRLSRAQIEAYMAAECQEQDRQSLALSSDAASGAMNITREDAADAFRRARLIERQL